MLAITGANGHLGRRLLAAAPDRSGVRALVRSARAAEQVRRTDGVRREAVLQVDYGDADGLAQALTGCSAVVHLVGIIKETVRNRYDDAHQRACRALAEAAARADLERIVYLSIVGASSVAGNACLASRGAAEDILLAGPVPAAVIRVPMVLGEDDYAARALAARARRRLNVVLRGSSLEQPIYAGDVVCAIQAAEVMRDGHRTFELAGPESLTRASLVHRAARVLGRRTRVLSLPLALGMAAAFVLEKTSSQPPVTRAMLGVLDHDDVIDIQGTVEALGLSLTPLDETLRRCIAAPLEGHRS